MLSVGIAAVVDEGVGVGPDISAELERPRPVLVKAKVGCGSVAALVTVGDDCAIPFEILNSKVNVLARRRPRRSEFVV